MWTQVVGKVRLALTPLRQSLVERAAVRARRAASRRRRCRIAAARSKIRVRFRPACARARSRRRDRGSRCRSSRGRWRTSHRALHGDAARAGIDVAIWTMPVEIPDPIRFEDDTVHASYDRDAVARFWRVLVTVDARVQCVPRPASSASAVPSISSGAASISRVTRFSGRRAPERAGCRRDHARSVLARSQQRRLLARQRRRRRRGVLCVHGARAGRIARARGATRAAASTIADSASSC